MNVQNPVLKLDKVTRKFGGLTAVDQVSFQLPKGCLYGLIGPNGAGKTTLFNLMTGVYPLSSGELSIFNKNTAGMSVESIARLGITRTFQSSRLFKSLSCLENIQTAAFSRLSYSPWESLVFSQRYQQEEKKLQEYALELLSLFKLENVAYQESGSLPYGAQRRLEIARCLATGAKILLLDEPAAGMNHRETDELAEWVRKVHKQFELTILLIEHDMKFVMNLCEWIFVLDHGVLIAQGNAVAIRQNSKVVEAYLGVEESA